MTSAVTRGRDGAVTLVVALASRLVVAAWASSAIPPTADGSFYHVVASRIAAGDGYTWAWPDGAVTYAAHYPVGYPALVAAGYALLGARPVVAMLVNALLGAAGAWAAWAMLAPATSRRLALAGGLAVGLHPALVPYTAALMTEGATAALLTLAVAFTARARQPGARQRGWLLAIGLTMGVATLVRPQVIALAPLFGWLSLGPGDGARRRVRAAVASLALVLAVCAPWTARNCARMDRCALVSVNGGWNLAIGAQTDHGAWQELAVPEACREVFAEAAKDTCFGREARAAILAAPGAWLARAPAKIRVTFDYFGAAPWYLHAASPERFPYRAKVVLGAVETVASRLLLAAALVAAALLEGPRRGARRIVCAVGVALCFVPAGAGAYLALALALVVLGPRALGRTPVVAAATAGVIATTALTHAVFFGAGRYGLVVVPFVTALAFVRARRAGEVGGTGAGEGADAGSGAGEGEGVASRSA